MITHATCRWCQQPIQLTLNGWMHQNGQGYAENGHCATPDRNKPPHRAVPPAPNRRFSDGHKKSAP